MVEPGADPAARKVKIWDVPTRLFHWVLAVLVLCAWIVVENESFSLTAADGRLVPSLEIHMWIGVFILTLVVFRVLWGFLGSGTARFTNFVRGPGAVIGYLRRLFSRGPGAFVPGHNPAGAAVIVLFLLLLAVQAGTGLFLSEDDGFFPFYAPLSSLVSPATGELLHEIHELNWALLQALIFLHIAAAVFYLLFKRENLIGAMFTGKRAVPPGEATPTLTFAPWWRAPIAFAVALAVVRGLLAIGGY